MAAPTGRAANPTNWVPKDDSVPARVDSPGKKTAGKTSAAAVPYRKKSYHSIVVPMVLATAALTRCEWTSACPSRCPVALVIGNLLPGACPDVECACVAQVTSASGARTRNGPPLCD